MTAVNLFATFGTVWTVRETTNCPHVEKVPPNYKGSLNPSLFTQQRQQSPPQSKNQKKRKGAATGRAGKGKETGWTSRKEQIFSTKSHLWIKAPPHTNKLVSAAEPEWIADGTTGHREISPCQRVHSNQSSAATWSQLSSKRPGTWRLSPDFSNAILVAVFFQKTIKQWAKLYLVRQNKTFSILF